MYYVINTMSAIQGDSLGTVISTHRTLRTASRGTAACQPREHGSYLPVLVVRSELRLRRGEHVAPSAVEHLTESEQRQMSNDGVY